jgi:hypothetical protein
MGKQQVKQHVMQTRETGVSQLYKKYTLLQNLEVVFKDISKFNLLNMNCALCELTENSVCFCDTRETSKRKRIN